MNARQRRLDRRRWRYSAYPHEGHWKESIPRCLWLETTFGARAKGRRYRWSSWMPTCYQFRRREDYMFFVLRWGTE